MIHVSWKVGPSQCASALSQLAGPCPTPLTTHKGATRGGFAALQAQVGAAEDMAQLVQRAQAAGFAITARELQLWAHDEAFTAPWWPWTGGGRAKRTAFFRSLS